MSTLVHDIVSVLNLFRGTVLHEMAIMKCSFACFTENSLSLLEYHKLEAADPKMYILAKCGATETFGKRCLKCDKGLVSLLTYHAYSSIYILYGVT